MNPETLSRELRTGSGPFLNRRRGIAALSMTAIGTMGLISLYQMGIIKHLPDPPLPYFNTDKVNGSDEAYARLATPDAVLGLGSYAVTLGLAAIGGRDRATEQPWMPLALAAKTLFDAALVGKFTVDQWTKYHTFCSWCLLSGGATFATVPLALMEARAAFQHLTECQQGRSVAISK